MSIRAVPDFQLRRRDSQMAAGAGEGGSMPNNPRGQRDRFQLTDGGFAHRLTILLRIKHPDNPNILRRAVLSVLVTWVPLLILSAIDGNVAGHHVRVSFLHDFAVHARFLFAVPMLILAEAVLGPRLGTAADSFVQSKLVVGDDVPQFEAAIDDTLSWRDSVIPDLVLILLSYTAAITTLLSTGVHVSTWYSTGRGTGRSLTIAGWWFVLLCVPLLHFLTLRWLWRLFLWAQFLWRMSRLDLKLDPLHPDGAGGLGFVGDTERYFGVLLFAFSIAVSGVLANAIVYDHLSLISLAPTIAIYVVLAVCIVLSPLLVFFRALVQTKRDGLYQYSTFATEYTSSFRKKWMSHPRQTGETLLGTADIQSLADLGNSYSFVEKTNYLPMKARTPINLAIACLIPMAPLSLTVMPVSEILKMLLKSIL
jgi:hypothetical protein